MLSEIIVVDVTGDFATVIKGERAFVASSQETTDFYPCKTTADSVAVAETGGVSSGQPLRST
jgi:hypothetical protein